MTKIYYLTKNGLKNIQREYEELKNLYKREILEEAPSMLEGDSLNPEFSVFQENIELLEQRIEELNHILKNYRIISKPSKKEQDKVDIGAKVILKNGSKKEEEYKIVGTLEADPFAGKISNESPLGVSFIGKKVGEVVSFNNDRKYKILKIQYEEA
ncbi:MAG: GreA/GreB family elongation factor [Candidatus Pacebacteria bacterium]|nr:GreA/GreB family elongation factor [Candidatus Paceibacterota bacterium]MDD2757102.1 GreA/GreB family elongation factor [Candidatus Paceibacterota bacterium]MDD3283627.1 GreA/GreB family elongation factor [Candidatus Paceibacterota bacterium]MDD3969750.1 GreA/GreB family elongation factor [Candidatus Paceibacterota bacterium]MDD4737655.1 GreA/GreB family elongation factor [Candidatus Paceibacterota bacterium]